jgi:hypothetical protein
VAHTASGQASQEAAEALLDDPAVSAAIAAALSRARPENQRVLIHWRSASADRSAELGQLLKEDRGVARKVLYEYQLVPVEIIGADTDVGTDEPDTDVKIEGADPDAQVDRADAEDELLTRIALDVEAARNTPQLTVVGAEGQVIASLHAAPLTTGAEIEAMQASFVAAREASGG